MMENQIVYLVKTASHHGSDVIALFHDREVAEACLRDMVKQHKLDTKSKYEESVDKNKTLWFIRDDGEHWFLVHKREIENTWTNKRIKFPYLKDNEWEVYI